MYKLDEFMAVVEEYAPLWLSQRAISDGDYDNSGIIVKSHDNVNKVLFSLDLSKNAVDEAEKTGADTIVTHHPAIYNPIKNLSFDKDTAPLLRAIKLGLNVISMHLNLDMANSGVDYYLAKALGAKDSKILFKLSDCDYGYGREFEVSATVDELKSTAKRVLGSDKIISYGKVKAKKVASFCGGGGSHALDALEKGLTDADVYVTSDVAHHVLKEIVERDKGIIIIPHYVSEQYGFKKFYEWAAEKTAENLSTYYFEDKRFM